MTPVRNIVTLAVTAKSASISEIIATDITAGWIAAATTITAAPEM